MSETVVIFRRDRDGSVFALFPELPADESGRCCTAYQHVGQHCAADYHGCIANSDPASLPSTPTCSMSWNEGDTT